MAAGQPVVSVDAKKKELVGQFTNGGRDYRPAGPPVPANVHDFLDPTLGKAIPYGVYDLGANSGWVSVGCDHDTAAFAVATLRNWWDHEGAAAYPHADRLLTTADGGSNGTRLRGPGRANWPPSPPPPASTSPSATCRPAPASGTKPGTGCSPTSR